MKKCKISILLTLLMSMLSTKVTAHDISATNADGKTIYYIWINNKTALSVSYRGTSHTSYSDRYEGTVRIPEAVTLNGVSYPVKSIASYAFYNCLQLSGVKIPNSVTNINSYAFQRCLNLAGVTFGSSVTTIGSSAFDSNSNITNVNVTVPDLAAFCNNKVVGLIRSHLGKSIQLIDGDGKTLKDYIVPEGVTSIGTNAFYNCKSLTSITIPNSLANIDNYAFSGCGNLESVNISDLEAWFNIDFAATSSNPLINARKLFLNGEEVKDLVIPSSVTTIKNYALSGCSSLNSVTIPNSVTSIGNQAFYYCSDLTSITFPISVTSIDSNAFQNCSSLTNVKVSVTDISAFCNNEVVGLIKTSIGKPIELIDENGNDILDYSIPEDVTSIGNDAFYNCTYLTSVTVPNSVRSIGDNAFYGCSGITSMSLGNSIMSIGDSAFDGCSELMHVSLNCYEIKSWFKSKTSIKDIIIGEEVTIIGENAFSGCSGIESMTIPNNVKRIGDDAFRDCI